MDNASKALLMAGGLLISILIISLTMYLINIIRGYNEGESMQTAAIQGEAYNRFFVFSQNIGGKISPYDAYNIILKIIDVNETEGEDVITLSFEGSTSWSLEAAANKIVNDHLTVMTDANGNEYVDINYTYSYKYEYNANGRINKVIIY